MIRWSTPTQPIVVHGADLTATGCHVVVTIEQGCARLDVEDPPMSYDSEADCTTISVGLTQEQTAAFRTGHADVQVNAVDWSGYRVVSERARVHVGSNLLDERVESDA